MEQWRALASHGKVRGKGKQEDETVCGGGGHGGVVLVVLLGLWAFVFDEIVNGIQFVFVGRKNWLRQQFFL